MRVLSLFALVTLLAAGCASHGGDPSVASTRGDGPSVSGSPKAPTSSAATSDTTPETEYIHMVASCTQEPCNCGTNETYLDAQDSNGDCDGSGGRPFLDPAEGLHRVASWPGRVATHGWANGATVAGTVYLTTDAASSYTYSMRLTANGTTYAASGPDDIAIDNGLLGATWTPFSYQTTMSHDVPAGTKLTLELWLEYKTGATSYFVGYEDDHATLVRIG